MAERPATSDRLRMSRRHLTALNAKEVIQAYYGKAAVHSYFVGSSKGGQEAMLEVQRRRNRSGIAPLPGSNAGSGAIPDRFRRRCRWFSWLLCHASHGQWLLERQGPAEYPYSGSQTETDY